MARSTDLTKSKTESGASTAKRAAMTEPDQTDEAETESDIDDEDGIFVFSMPPEPTGPEKRLAADIVMLDHAKKRQLKKDSAGWTEVHWLIYNAIVDLLGRDPANGRRILEKAQHAYFHHNQTANRLRYLAGVLAGMVVAACLGTVIVKVVTNLSGLATSSLLALIFTFAGIGSLTSVLMRISSIDLRKETGQWDVIISGFSRPVVAVSMSLIVYLIIQTKIVDIKFGEPATSISDGVYMVTSFLCGFSERFAKDIFARLPFGEAKDDAKEG